MSPRSFTIVPVDGKNRQTAVEFLQAHEDTAQFLLNNLREYGPVLTAHHNSGNFKVVYQSGQVVGVFCLTRRGNLLVQASGEAAALILQSCAQESLALKGFIGDWNSVEPILQQFRADHPEFKPSYESKEILYRYDLKPDDPWLKHDSRVRLLGPNDFELWNPLNLAYLEELKLSSELNDEARRGDFIKSVAFSPP